MCFLKVHVSLTICFPMLLQGFLHESGIALVVCFKQYEKNKLSDLIRGGEYLQILN